MLEEIITDVGDEEIRTVEAEKDAAIDKITLSMLNSITLDRLPNLITFHSGSNTLECPSLTDIYIIDCPKMKAFVFPDDMKDHSIRSASLFNEKVAFPCLKELRTVEAEKDAAIDKITLSMLNSITLDRLPNLITFHSGSNTLECPSLTDIYIIDCPKMEAFVFPDDMKDPSIRSASLFNEKMEAFVFPDDMKDPSIRSASLFNEKAGFPSLEKMVISDCLEEKIALILLLNRRSWQILQYSLLNIAAHQVIIVEVRYGGNAILSLSSLFYLSFSDDVAIALVFSLI
ncbi:hypothetical protein Q3G72_015806 [Acer saccharum]|nr:hypothetical protein Q3G72_015806 [Acer saccharum]